MDWPKFIKKYVRKEDIRDAVKWGNANSRSKRLALIKNTLALELRLKEVKNGNGNGNGKSRG